MASSTVAQPELEQIQRMGSADLVIGILNPGADDLGVLPGILHQAVASMKSAARVVVLCRGLSSESQTRPEPQNGEFPAVAFLNWAAPEAANATAQALLESYQTVLTVSSKLGARACVIIASELRPPNMQLVICRLTQPLLELGFDLVSPRYDRQKTEGLLNRSIIAPLGRALYGERIQNPIGPDFGLSGRLLETILARNQNTRVSQGHAIASIASTAVCQGLQICESYLGMRVQMPTQWTDLSSLLATVLGPVFIDVEMNAPFWQRVRGSQPVPWFGNSAPVTGEPGVLDVQHMIESFHLGAQNFEEIWESVLPPTTLLELKRLARLPAEHFHVPDNLWASMVYDLALGHRLRTINRDHLLRSITPLYRGWIASYAIEMENAGPQQVEARLEQLSAVFEARKPYLVSRWRWPDRFNP